MAKNKPTWSKLWKTEDWLAVWIGFIVILTIHVRDKSIVIATDNILNKAICFFVSKVY